jgi:class 3 adenylate cyclase
VVAASVYAEWMQFSRGEPDLFGQRAIGLGIAAFGLVGALLLYRRPGHRLGWLLAGIGLLALLGGSANEYVLAVTRSGGLATDFLAWLVWLSNWFWWPVAGGVFVFLPLLFPDGRPPTARWWWVAMLGVVAILGLVLTSAFQERYEATILGEIPSIENPLGIEGLTNAEGGVLNEIPSWILLAAFVGAVVSMAVRYRRSRGVERLQLKWFSYAVGLMLSWTLLGEVLWVSVLGHDDVLGGSVLPFGLLLTFIPITIAVAILRYRLFAIDRIISRTVAYALVVAILTGGYLGVVVGVGAVVDTWAPSVGGGLDLPLPILATALIAIAFQPVRRRALGLANRWVYGKRRTPYEALAGVGGDSLEELLPQIARLATESTAARQALIWLFTGTELRPAVVFPDDSSLPSPVPLDGGDVPATLDDGQTFPLTHQDDLLGAMTVRMGAGEELTADDSRLLADLAAHAAVTLRGVLDAVPLPTGIVTFLMTDIEGSTRLWEEDPEAMAEALREHDRLVRQTVTDQGGLLVKWRGEGDSTFSVFTNAAEAIGAAAALQDAFGGHEWPTPRPLSVRAALHTGQAELRERDYFGQAVNRCARLRSLARGGQTLVSAATRELAREGLPETMTLIDLGERQLKDMSEPEHVYQVGPAMPQSLPPQEPVASF